MDVFLQLVTIADKLSLIGALLIAVWWFNRRDKINSMALEKDRFKHEEERKARIVALETRAESCEKDRMRIHEEMAELKVEIAKLKFMLEQLSPPIIEA